MRMLATLCALCALSMPAVLAQTTDATAKPLTDTDIQLMRSDVQSARTDIVNHTMLFTPAESTAFTPVYQAYVKDQHAIGDEKLSLIKDYANNIDTMDDAKANSMTLRLLAIDQKSAALRQTYWPKFVKALGAKRAAMFYQVDNRLNMLINLQLAANIPLVQ
jgi:hypothetical protein